MIGKPWGKERIRYILSNEKYIGDSLFQKTFTPNVLPLKNRPNRGEVEMDSLVFEFRFGIKLMEMI